MKAIIRRSELSGVVSAPPSKSSFIRALFCSLFADAPVFLRCSGLCEDMLAAMSCVAALGAELELRDDGVMVSSSSRVPAQVSLDCGGSGAVLRFLMPVTASTGVKARFSGNSQLSHRPLSELLSVMRQNGVSFSGDGLPLEMSGRIHPGTYRLPGYVSSQYVSGLLMALPRLAGDSKIELIGDVCSRPYIDMTLDILSRFGIKVESRENCFFVPGGQNFHSPGVLQIEGDWSAGAFLLAAGALWGDVTVNGLQLGSKQGDKEIIRILKEAGASVIIENDTVRAVRSKLLPFNEDLSRTPDLLPVLAAMAPWTKGQTVLKGYSGLRQKESDRISASASVINALGGTAFERGQDLVIENKPLTGGVTPGFGDHRMVMCAAIAAAGASVETIITGTDAVSKSYPRFFNDLIGLSLNATMIK